MNLDKFDEPLKAYVESLSLTATQDGRINSALESILGIMIAAYPEAKVYAQGSFSTDTMAKPLTDSQSNGSAGEYDVDIAIEREEWGSAGDALGSIASLIEDDGTFAQMSIDKTKNSCVRIVYAPDGSGVGFHIDLVPTKIEKDARFAPDRENDAWKPSDAKQFADWFNDQASRQPELRSIALIIKRLRDCAGLTDDLKSILVLTLIAKAYYANGSIMGDLLAVLSEINAKFSDEQSSVSISNPANDGEDLVDTIGDYNAVRAFFLDTNIELNNAVSDDDAEALRNLFGAGFSYKAAEKATKILPATPIQAMPAYGVSDASIDEK